MVGSLVKSGGAAGASAARVEPVARKLETSNTAKNLEIIFMFLDKGSFTYRRVRQGGHQLNSMPAQNQPVVDPLGLAVFKRRQVGHRGRLRLAQDGLGQCLQGPPSWQLDFGRMHNLPDHAAPFNDDTVDIARADQVTHPAVLVERILVDGGDDLLRARAVLRWHAVLEIAGDRLVAKYLMARNGQPAGPSVLFPAKAEARIQIRQVINKFINGITLVFQSRGNCQTVS